MTNNFYEYKVVYFPENLSRLVEKARGSKGDNIGASEAASWNIALQSYTKDEWRVKNSGILSTGMDAIFWALLEKEIE